MENNNDDKLYEQLIDVRQQLQWFKQQEEILVERVIKKFQAEHIDRAENRGMVIRLSERTIWKYTPAVTSKSEELKLLKSHEEATGQATKTMTPFLRLTLRDKK
mgnify:CR=1 FL=1